ncbi:hypothetical protein [Lacinutrix chionoecetis]
MKITKLLIIALFLFGSLTNTFAQENTANNELNKVALEMFNNFNAKNYDALIDMTHPKLFEIVPKESMVPVIKSMLEGNADFEIEIPNEIPDYKISKIFKDEENDAEYAFLSYDMKMKMTFKNQEFDEESQEMMVKMMKVQGMEVEFISNNTLNAVIKNSITIFIKDKDTDNNWYMLNYDADSPMLFQLLSTQIIEDAKEYKQNLMLESKKEN